MVNKKSRSSTGSSSSMVNSKTKKQSASSQTTTNNESGPKQIGAFKTLRIGKHWCYMRAHVGGEDERTMFLVNLPIDSTERHVRTIFQKAGQIESVRLWKGKGVELMVEGEEEEEVVEENRQLKGSKQAKSTTTASAPKVIPLPSLDPREPNTFLPTSTSAHITFLDESSLHRALEIDSIKSWPDPFKGIADAQSKLNEDDLESSVSSGKKRSRNARTAEEASARAVGETTGPPPVGFAFLLARHRALRPSLEAVKEHADSVMAMFEYKLKNPQKFKSKSKTGLGVGGTGTIEAVSFGPNGELLDADGFTIVQSTGKYGRTTDGQGGSVKVARSRAQGEKSRHGGTGESEEGPEKKKKRLELDDFYRFQRREAKREELADLRSKFQADQEKIKQLKASRNFKPF